MRTEGKEETEGREAGKIKSGDKNVGRDRWGQRNRQRWGLGGESEALYLRAGRRGPGWGAPGSPAQARRRSGRSTGGGLAGAGGGNPPPTRNCLLAEGGVTEERRTRSDPQTLLEHPHPNFRSRPPTQHPS